MQIESCEEGVILTIRAFPGAKRNETRFVNDCVKVFVTQVPEKGKANEAIRKQIADFFDIRASQVELMQGETSAQKKFLLRGVCEEEIMGRLQV